MPKLALDPDPAAVRDDDPSRDREAEPRSLVRACRAAPVPLKRCLPFVLADPWTVI